MGPVVTSGPAMEAKAIEAIKSTADGPAQSRKDRLAVAVKPLLREHLSARSGHWDDRTVSLVAAEISRIVLASTSSNNPKCLPEQDGNASFLDLAVREDKGDILESLVRTDPNFTPRVATKEEMGKAMALRIADIARIGGLFPEQVLSAYTDEANTPPSVTCRVMGGMIGALAAMPPAEGAPLLRAVAKF